MPIFYCIFGSLFLKKPPTFSKALSACFAVGEFSPEIIFKQPFCWTLATKRNFEIGIVGAACEVGWYGGWQGTLIRPKNPRFAPLS